MVLIDAPWSIFFQSVNQHVYLSSAIASGLDHQTDLCAVLYQVPIRVRYKCLSRATIHTSSEGHYSSRSSGAV